jgi:hypothetical protein
MANIIAKYLSANATMAGADAFKETAITTNLNPADGYAFQVERIEFSLNNAIAGWAGADSNFQVVLARDTKLAIAKLSDPDVMYKKTLVLILLTAAGFAWVDGTWTWIAPSGVYIVEPTIYLQIDADATGLTMDLDARIFYSEVKLSEVEILRLLNNV